MADYTSKESWPTLAKNICNVGCDVFCRLYIVWSLGSVSQWLDDYVYNRLRIIFISVCPLIGVYKAQDISTMTARRKYIRIICWSLVVILIIMAGIVGVMVIFFSTSASYHHGQDEYFSKVDYHLEGSVKSYQNVGGSYYLIEFTPTTFEISKNKINNGDSHVGVYSSDSSSVMIIASTPLSLKDDMEYVEISSRNRHIIFNDSICNTLRTAGTYEHILPSSLNGKFIKF